MNGVATEALHILTQSSTAPPIKEEVKDIFVCKETAENKQSFRQGCVKRRAKFLEILVVKGLLPSGRLFIWEKNSRLCLVVKTPEILIVILRKTM